MIRSRTLGIATLLAATVGLSACDAVTGGQNGSPIGVGGIAARTKGAGYTTNPQIAFYRVSGATFVSAAGVRDTCFITSYGDTTTGGTTSATALSAGSAVLISIGSRTDTLLRTGVSLDPTYRSQLTSGIPYTPGDSMVITVPGDRGGFPTATFRGRTAEAFSMSPLVIPAAGSGLSVTWTPATDPNAAMFVTFRYATAGAASFNRQIACSYVDDGSGTVPATVSQDFIAATMHDMIGQRVRTILATIDVPLAYFNVVSTFDWPTPISP
jgi:hypothetical protein